MTGLTDEEKDVLAKIAAAWNAFVELKGGLGDEEADQFLLGIHQCEQVIALRLARRVDPDVWRQS